MLAEGQVIWEPEQGSVSESQIERFRRTLAQEKGIDLSSYGDLHDYSVRSPEDFWEFCWRFLDIRGDRPLGLSDVSGTLTEDQRRLVLSSRDVEGARFFPNSQINFAENLIAGMGESLKVFSVSESVEEVTRTLTTSQFVSEVARVADGLRKLGVTEGDRVVGYLPNQHEALIAFVAAASMGAVWSCCSPDFGVSAVVDRFKQIDPKVLFFVSAYRYGSKVVDRRSPLAEIISALPNLRAAIEVDYLPGYECEAVEGVQALRWDELGSTTSELNFSRVEFSSPLWILFSSGTTGLPKPIVHSHGGITLELKKTLALQHDLRSGRRFFWFTTTGWMMWNYLISGLLVGADLVLFDGNPGYPDLMTLWRLCSDLCIDTFGISAPFVSSCLNAGIGLAELDLTPLRVVGSTGAPLSLDGFDYLKRQLGDRVQIVSASGGTDVCTAFLSSSPMSKTYAGKLSCATLGSAVASYSSEYLPVIGEVGELVLELPLPSMPVAFWGDSDGSRLHDAYFAAIPGAWRHGDWIRIDEDGSSVIFGRSDSTLNRDGVRMGTAEFYRVIESESDVVDSLVVDTSNLGRGGELIVFLVLAQGATLDDALSGRIRSRIREELSPRHVPDRLIAVSEIPRTINGKKLEVPIRKLILGAEMAEVAVAGSLANPNAVEELVRLSRSDG